MQGRHVLAMVVAVSVFWMAAGMAAGEWSPAESRLLTRWVEDIDPAQPWPSYPRPTMQREGWLNLNGMWEYAITPAGREQAPESWDGEILVPYCIESALSGVGKRVSPEQRLWYRTSFEVPAGWDGERVLLHFGAVDWDAKVFVNGQLVGNHRGCYDPFYFDVTKALKDEGSQEIVVSVWDPTDTGAQPRGKQVVNPRGIWYTPVTGIWQTVWVEPVTEAYIKSMKIVPDVDNSAVGVTVYGSDEGNVKVEVKAEGKTVGRAEGRTGRSIVVEVDDARLWGPEDPFLYDLVVTLEKEGTADRVESYVGMRKIEVAKDEAGINRLFLNGEALFQFGPLDQGWWPDGLYTAPTEEALRYDIEVTQDLGFNMLRKHVKVEPELFYYYCDQMGMLVWQDMPSTSGELEWIRDPDVEGPDMIRSSESAAQFRYELDQMIGDFYNHPSIVMWVPFNERWGQFDTETIVSWVRRLDPTRLVNEASGGNFRDIGDVVDIHQYPGPRMPELEEHRAAVLGEFGGLGLPVSGHTWQDERNWGYRTYQTREALQEAYLSLIHNLEPLMWQGLAAAVYTQTTDVEVEVNGFMTYDRAVLKMDTETLREANTRLYADPGRVEMKVLVPTAQEEPQRWRYTTEEPAGEWMAPRYDARGWQEGLSGFGVPATPGSIVNTRWNTKDIWLRREFRLRDTDVEELFLKIHRDDDAEVYLNGELIQKIERWSVDYELRRLGADAKGLLREGRNVLAVHCRQEGGDQYIDVGLVEISR